MKKILLAIIISIFLLAGCTNNQITQMDESLSDIQSATETKVEEPTVNEKEPEDIVEEPIEPEIEVVIESNHILSNLEPGPIESEEILEYLYATYYYNALPTILNGDSFDSADEIEPYLLYDFAVDKYILEHASNPVEEIPIDQLNQYLLTYFNLEAVETDTLREDDYNKLNNSINLRGRWNPNEPASYSENTWQYRLENVEVYEEGIIIAELATYFSDGNLDELWTIALQASNQGTGEYYFSWALNEFFSKNEMAIIGNYYKTTALDQHIDEQYGRKGQWYYIGEIDQYVIMEVYPMWMDGHHSIRVFSKESEQFEYEFDLVEAFGEDEFWSDYSSHIIKTMNTEMYGEVICIMTNTNVVILDERLNEMATILVPDMISEQMVPFEYEEVDDSLHLLDGFFGYDIASDLTTYTFSTEEGLYTYNSNVSELKMIQESFSADLMMSDVQHIHNPYFVADTLNVMSVLYGYEWYNGYLLYLDTSQEVLLHYHSFDTLSVINQQDDTIFMIKNYEETGYVSTGISMITGEEIPISQVYVTAFESLESYTISHYMIMADGYITYNDYDYIEDTSKLFMVDNKGDLIEDALNIRNGYIEALFGYETDTGYKVFTVAGSTNNYYQGIVWDVTLDQ